ncbi:MAG: carbon storage regulator [Gemmataceae bacterium]|nr:carbon storage regulator [Gemmataceae bacterium]
MLVLTRKPGEKIRIGKNIVLTIIEVVGNRVRVGIEAPEEIAVVRGELLARPPVESPPQEAGKPLVLCMELMHAH